MTSFEERWIITASQDYKLPYVQKHRNKCCEDCICKGRRQRCETCIIAEAFDKAESEIISGERSFDTAAQYERGCKIYINKKGYKTQVLF